MYGGRARRSFVVLSCDKPKNLLVFAQRLRRARRLLERGEAEGAQIFVRALDLFLETRHSAELVESVVELSRPFANIVAVAGEPRVLSHAAVIPKLVDFVRRYPVYDDLDRADLERLAYRVVLAYVLFRIFRYDEPLARHGLDEPFALEHTQRFAHRHTAHAELLRYLGFNQPLAARYVSVKYPLAQKICDLSAKRAPLRQFQARVYSYRHTVTLPTPYACL